jgi:hypothetical protein
MVSIVYDPEGNVLDVVTPAQTSPTMLVTETAEGIISNLHAIPRLFAAFNPKKAAPGAALLVNAGESTEAVVPTPAAR